MKRSERIKSALNAMSWFAVVFIAINLSHRLIEDEDTFLMVVISMAYVPLFLLLGALDDIKVLRQILDDELDDNNPDPVVRFEPPEVCGHYEGDRPT